MKITVGDFKDMRGEDMPIILGNCKYVTGYGASRTIDGPWGWMVHTGDCDAMKDYNHMANDDMGFHFLWDGLDFVEVDTDKVEINSDAYSVQFLIFHGSFEYVELSDFVAYDHFIQAILECQFNEKYFA